MAFLWILIVLEHWKVPMSIIDNIETKMKYGGILGPFEDHPFHCHISTFLTREKLNSSN